MPCTGTEPPVVPGRVLAEPSPKFDWRSPVWRHYLVEAQAGGDGHPLRRGEATELSDREVSDFSSRRRVDDLAAVVDDAGLEFALITPWPRAVRCRCTTCMSIRAG